MAAEQEILGENPLNTWSALTLSVLLTVFLAACVGPSRQEAASDADADQGGGGRYSMEHDSPELEPFDVSQVKPVIPVAETRTIAGNKSPYTVNGETYRVMESEAGYSATGLASWYGRKFHGHLTSNGEVYDMFQLTAAHRSLPIPSYVRVTNLDNGRNVLVRVNDRGPFHSERIIDLSYAAASMLGFAADGTAPVRVEAVMPGRPRLEARTLAGGGEAGRPAASGEERTAPEETAATSRQANNEEREAVEGEFLQVGAFSNIDVALDLLTRLDEVTSLPAFIHSAPSGDSARVLHRVRLGPLNSSMDVNGLIRSIIEADLGEPYRVRP